MLFQYVSLRQCDHVDVGIWLDFAKPIQTTTNCGGLYNIALYSLQINKTIEPLCKASRYITMYSNSDIQKVNGYNNLEIYNGISALKCGRVVVTDPQSRNLIWKTMINEYHLPEKIPYI